jgi:hypothetical protein
VLVVAEREWIKHLLYSSVSVYIYRVQQQKVISSSGQTQSLRRERFSRWVRSGRRHGAAVAWARRVGAAARRGAVKTWPDCGAPGHRGAGVAAREKREQNGGVQHPPPSGRLIVGHAGVDAASELLEESRREPLHVHIDKMSRTQNMQHMHLAKGDFFADEVYVKLYVLGVPVC